MKDNNSEAKDVSTMKHQEVTKTQEEIDLQLAQETLAKAKQRLADAQEAKLAAQRTAIANAEAEAVRKRNQELAEYEARVAETMRKRREKEEEERAEGLRKEAEARRMQEELSKLELEQQAQRKREAMLQQLADDAARIEREAKQAESEAIRMNTPTMIEPEATVQTSPLSFLWKTDERVAPSAETPKQKFAQVDACTIELRVIQSHEANSVAQVWEQKLHTRATGNSVQPLLQRFEPAVIITAIEALAQYPQAVAAGRNVQESLLSSVLYSGTEDLEARVDLYIAAHVEQAEIAKAQREGREYVKPVVAVAEPVIEPVATVAEPVAEPVAVAEVEPVIEPVLVAIEESDPSTWDGLVTGGM